MYVVTPGDLLVLPGSNQIGPSTWAMLTSRPSADVSSINLFISLTWLRFLYLFQDFFGIPFFWLSGRMRIVAITWLRVVVVSGEIVGYKKFQVPMANFKESAWRMANV